MNEQLETSFVPEREIPKQLVRQAAEVFMLNLVNYSLPIIQTLSFNTPQASSPEGTGETFKITKEQEYMNNLMLNKLIQLKEWYWEDLEELCGECDSKIRCIISTALMEVIHVKEIFRAIDPLHKLSLQLLFACEAGDIGGLDPYDIDPTVAHQFSNFLISLSPFYIRGLRDNCIKFHKSHCVSYIMVNSDDLRRIQLYYNISSVSLERLRINCLKAEAITLDFVNELKTTKLVMSDTLFKAFFENKGRETVFQLLNSGREVPKSFPNLKEIRIRCDHIIRGFTPFIQCLQYAYSKVKLTVSCLVSEPFDFQGLKYPFVCPSIQVYDRDDGRKVLCVYFANEDLKIDETTGPSPTRVADTDLFLYCYRAFFTNTFYMEEILSMMQLCNLRYIFSEDMKLEVSPRIAYNPDKLRILYVFGPTPDEAADEGLAYNLNQCPDLKVLGITIKPMTQPTLDGLSPLNELRILSIYFTALIPCSASVSARVPNLLKGPLYLEEAEQFLELMILASPNIEVLEAPCMRVVVDLIDHGYLKKIHTLSITFGVLENIMDCVLKLPNLKVLLLEKFVDPNIFYELRRRFRYTKLQISYKAGRHVLPYLF